MHFFLQLSMAKIWEWQVAQKYLQGYFLPNSIH